MPCSKDRHTKIGSLSTFASVLCIFGCPLLVSPYRPCFIFNRLCHWEKFYFIIACSSSDIFHRDKVSLVLFTNLHIKLNINPLLRIPCIHFLSKYSVTRTNPSTARQRIRLLLNPRVKKVEVGKILDVLATFLELNRHILFIYIMSYILLYLYTCMQISTCAKFVTVTKLNVS